MRRHTTTFALTLTVAFSLSLSGCGVLGLESGDESAEVGEEETAGSEEEETTEDVAPVDLVRGAVDATFENDRLTLESLAELQVGAQEFSLSSEGSVDYEAVISDVEIGVEQESESSEVSILADGTSAWVSGEGAQFPDFPGGASWVQGDAAALGESDTFEPSGLLGAIVALRAAEDVEELDSADYDDVETRVFETTVAYLDAVDAAGDDAEAFRSALSLTGAAEAADLAITVAVGPDRVIRAYDLEVVSTADVSGGYDIDIADVGDEVQVPTLPDPADTATGEEAEQIFADLLDS